MLHDGGGGHNNVLYARFCVSKKRPSFKIVFLSQGLTCCTLGSVFRKSVCLLKQCFSHRVSRPLKVP